MNENAPCCKICYAPFPIEFESQRDWIEIRRITEASQYSLICPECYSEHTFSLRFGLPVTVYIPPPSIWARVKAWFTYAP